MHLAVIEPISTPTGRISTAECRGYLYQVLCLPPHAPEMILYRGLIGDWYVDESMSVDRLERQLDEIARQLARLPTTVEPPPTTLQLLGRGRKEGDWQDYLAHFLDPAAPHGLGATVTEAFLKGLDRHDEIRFDYSPFHLNRVEVATEVPVPGGRIDLLLWCEEEWFILCELKIDATEADQQTVTYVEADSFDGVNLNPEDVSDDEQYYLYVAPGAPQPTAKKFTPIDWDWVADRLQAVQDADFGAHPARTTEQLNDFTDTIDTELTMTDHEKNEAAKANLYVDHYDDLSEVQSAFERQWTNLLNEWGSRLASTLEDGRVVETPENVPPAPENDVLIELPDGSDRRRLWLCRQANGNWSWLFPTDWWTNLKDGSPIYRNESPNARVGFLHRPTNDRETALGAQELTFYLRNAPSGNEDFYPKFSERINNDDAIEQHLPAASSRYERKSNKFEATYDIEVETHGDFFTAYVEALATAVDDHIVSNHNLIERLDEIYAETLKGVM